MHTEKRQLFVPVHLSPSSLSVHLPLESAFKLHVRHPGESRNVPRRGAPNTLLTLILRPAATRASQLPQQRQQRSSVAADGGNYAKLNKQRGCKQTRIHQARPETEPETESELVLESKSPQAERPVLSGCLAACSPGCLQQVFATQQPATNPFWILAQLLACDF